MLRIVGIATNLPQVSFHGLFTIGCILLCEDGLAVGRYVLQGLGAGCHSSRNRGETALDAHLFLRERGGSGVGISRFDVHALAVGVGRFRNTVGRDDILATLLAVFLAQEGHDCCSMSFLR